MRFILISAIITVAACGGGGSANSTPAPPDPGTTAIFDVQGPGSSSPLDGENVTIEGVVTGDFQDGDSDVSRNLGGFYIQDDSDSDSSTSDGVFVFDGTAPVTDVNVGDRVQVAGTVNEYYGETQISASTVAVVGTGTIIPAPVNLPAVATVANSDGELIADLENYEGMLVTFPQTLTVSQLRNLERYGEILLSEGGREYSYTNLNAPDTAGYAAHVEAVSGRRIYLDDGLRSNNAASPIPIRNGDEISGLTGVVRYSRGSGSSGTETYRLMPTIDPQFDIVNQRPGSPVVDGALRVAAVNLNNFFTTVDTGEHICGPAGDANCRGADSQEELTRQLHKIVTMLQMLDAHIVAVAEFENNESESLQAIIDGLNAAAGSGSYDYVATGTIGHDAIKVGLIYQPTVVRLVGRFALLDSSADPRYDDSRHRPSLAQTFEAVSNQGRLTVVAVHLKSKSSSCASDGDPKHGDGQSHCSATRTMGAAALVDWLSTDPTSSGDDDFVIVGDFNALVMEDAMSLFESAGFKNMAPALLGEEVYSFEYEGQFGTVDHAVASPSLVPQIVDALEWHINADEPQLKNYNLDFGRDPALFDPATPYRASDHDPLIIGIELSQ